MDYIFLAADKKYYATRAEALEHGNTVDVIPDFPDGYDCRVTYGPEITGDPMYDNFFDS